MTKEAATRAAFRRLSLELERQLADATLEVGETWFLVSSSWWMRVFGTCPRDEHEDQTDDDSEGSDDAAMLPRGNAAEFQVKNAPLVDVHVSSRKRHVAVLKPMLMEGPDYRLVNQRVWTHLSDSFGFDWEIPRPVVTRGPTTSHRFVEVYPFAFEVWAWRTGLDKPVAIRDPEQKRVVVTASAHCSLKELQGQICNAAAVVPELDAMFPNLVDDVSTLAVQICYRRNEQAPWTPLSDAVVKDEERTKRGFGSGMHPDPGVERLTVGELNLEHSASSHQTLHQVLVEGRWTTTDDESTREWKWRHGKFYSAIEANAWRFALQEGELLDALDTDNKWYESRVVELEPDRIKVHYRGWSAKWDEWIKRTSTRIAPLHTRVRNWRNFQLGDEVLVGTNVAGKVYPEWRLACVTDRAKIRDGEGSFRVELDVDGSKQWRDAQDELLCPVGTHKAVNAAARAPSRALVVAPSSSYARYDLPYETGRGRPAYEGVVGLTNLGNTCFMNSMLQCLINTAPLREYFLRKDAVTGAPFFTQEINRDNPLGLKGIMAVDFATLLRKMWSNEYRVVTPTTLKAVIGQYAPQFAGYQQQDSQEFMSFLLDGLHEDLNRVKLKPYTTPVDRRGRSDDDVAQEEWRQFRRRNDSIIVDHFMGQLRSHVTCANPACKHESITFDPFMSLSVPLPNPETVTLHVQVFWATGSIPVHYAMRLPKDKCLLVDAREKLSALARVAASRLVLVEVWQDRILKVYHDKVSMDRVREGSVHAYELDVPVTAYTLSSPSLRPLGGVETPDASTTSMYLVELVHEAPVASPLDGRVNAGDRGNLSEDDELDVKARRVELELRNTPLLVSIGQKWTKRQVHDKVWQIVHRLVATAADGTAAGGCAREPDLPYRLHVTDVKGGTRLVPDVARTDDPMDLPDRPFRITLEWSRKGYNRGYDETSAKRIELDESIEQLKISPKPDRLTLLQCLSKFTEREQLGEADAWYCPKCQTHVRAFKKFDLFTLPNVLIFHLKRFRYAQNSFYLHRDKIATLVDFPIEALDLSRFVIGPSQHGSIYELYAVSEHLGGLGGGHYTAVAKNPVTKRWFSFNDGHTSPTSAEAAVSPQAYVLFYIRREVA